MTNDLLCYRDDIPLPSRQQRRPIRPLGLFSDYVVSHMPHVQSSAQLPDSGLLINMCGEARALLRDLPFYDTYQAPPFGITTRCRHDKAPLRKLAHLDAAMLEQTYVRHAGGTVPPTLLELTDLCVKTGNSSHDKNYAVPALTYEGLIHTNPLRDDPRVFSDGEVARAEVLFYEVHRRIEDHIARTLIALRQNLNTPFEQTHACIDTLRQGFLSLHRGLMVEEFQSFRGYFQNSHRGFPGPSGLYSAGIVALDNFLAASAIGLRPLQEYKLRQKDYFPTTSAFLDYFCGQTDMKSKKDLQRGESLFYHGNPTGIEDLLFLEQYSPSERKAVATSMQNIRKLHRKTVKRFLPDALANTTVGGTAGVKSLQTFLSIAEKAYGDIADTIPLSYSLPTNPFET